MPRGMRYIARILARILTETPVRIHLSLRHGFAEKGRFDTSSGYNGLLFSFLAAAAAIWHICFLIC